MDRLIRELTRLPGVGPRSAERMAFHLLRSPAEDALALARAIEDVRSKLRPCEVCHHLAMDSRCAICTDDRRDRGLVLVVEQPRDVIAMEQSGQFRGVYHVLMGRLSPLEGVGPAELTVAELLARVADPSRNAGGQPVREVVLGLSPTFESDGTMLYLVERLGTACAGADRVGAGGAPNVRISRLARGLASGSSLEYASAAGLADAIEGRIELGPSGR